MILKGSQRAGGIQLARHLLNTKDNEHVTVHEIRGFVSDTLTGAFTEAYAISCGTKCRQFLFSLSLSPPETERVPVEIFEQAIIDIEGKMGLTSQPRAIVFHEKEGRRHAHCVWSRIDIETMTAANLPHYKLKLRDKSRQLYLENDWQMPRGLMNSKERDPLNYSMAEWQQAKRLKINPCTIKEAFQDCWAISDGRNAFASALEERGYYLAKGDRRGHVAVDWRGEIYAVSRWVGIKAKEVRAKLGDPDGLPSVGQTRKWLSGEFTDKLRHFSDQEMTRYNHAAAAFENKRLATVAGHRQTRAQLKQTQDRRWLEESKIRSRRLPTGLKALWFRLTGKYQIIKIRNEAETLECNRRDQSEFQSLIEKQLSERWPLQHEQQQLRHHHTITTKRLYREMSKYLTLSPEEQATALSKSSRHDTKHGKKRSRVYER